RVGDLLDAPLVAATAVERLARPSPQDHSLDRRAVVLAVQPLAPVGAVAIERQRLVVERARGEERDDLLGVLPRAVVVRAVRDGRREAEGLVVCTDDQLRRRLRCVIWSARAIRVLLRERVG